MAASQNPLNQPPVNQAAIRRRQRVMRVVNVPMRAMLSLPFRTPLSQNLMLLCYTGRKTGRAYRVPVSYAREGQQTLLSPGGGSWKLSLGGGRPVRIRLRGRDVSARPELLTDPEEVQQAFAVILRENPRAARFIPLPRAADGCLEPAALGAALSRGFTIVRWHLA